MGASSAIAWTDASWNVVVGCSRVSAGCDGCYAARDAAGRLRSHPVYAGLSVRPADGGLARFTGEVRFIEDRLGVPLRWRRSRMVFVNSMSDLFHPGVSDGQIARVFAVMAVAGWHTYQVLTKRPARARALLDSPVFLDQVQATVGELGGDALSVAERWPLPHVWLGTSIEADRFVFRARDLRETSAAVRFLSLEPLIGAVPSLDLEGIDWVIAGGESGPRARAMDPGWVRDIRDRCAETGVALFVKQAGVVLAGQWGCKRRAGGEPAEWPEEFRVRQFPGRAMTKEEI